MIHWVCNVPNAVTTQSDLLKKSKNPASTALKLEQNARRFVGNILSCCKHFPVLMTRATTYITPNIMIFNGFLVILLEENQAKMLLAAKYPL